MGLPTNDTSHSRCCRRGNAPESQANSYTCSWEMGQMAPRGGRFTDHSGKTVVAQPHEDIRSLVDYKSVPQTGQHKGKFYFQGAVYEGAWNGKMPHGQWFNGLSVSSALSQLNGFVGGRTGHNDF